MVSLFDGAVLRASDSDLINLLNEDLTDLRRDFDTSSTMNTHTAGIFLIRYESKTHEPPNSFL